MIVLQCILNSKNGIQLLFQKKKKNFPLIQVCVNMLYTFRGSCVYVFI